MSKLCVKCHRIETNAPDGVCGPCRASIRAEQGIEEEGMKVDKVKKTSQRIEPCLPAGRCACGNQIEGRSKLCPDCLHEKKKKYEREWKKGKEHTRCDHPGCKKGRYKDRFCAVHYREEYGKSPYEKAGHKKNKTSQVSRKNISAQTRGQDAEPGRRKLVDGYSEAEIVGARVAAVLNVIPVKTGIQKQNGVLAQILYISAELDKQIHEVLETDKIDARVILDIRFRLGEVLRGSL